MNLSKKVIVRIQDLLDQHGISLRELSRQSGVRHSTLSALKNHKRENINFSHIEEIAEALDIDDIRKIIDLKTIDSD